MFFLVVACLSLPLFLYMNIISYFIMCFLSWFVSSFGICLQTKWSLFSVISVLCFLVLIVYGVDLGWLFNVCRV